eukprot:TRINITY_DN104812_c0_g1_i1.p1 TRINITY_DN104812_c0_g1~~TRINITY_DN104812_c0_g1_i1.p1  ORF type:complete len:735 (+),score=97.79 TRINITY_DN104812_c0_g1_i1:68-2206(+)
MAEAAKMDPVVPFRGSDAAEEKTDMMSNVESLRDVEQNPRIPKLFENKEKKGGCCGSRRKETARIAPSAGNRGSMHILEEIYPMHVISVKDLMGLDSMQPHQDLVELGLVVPFDDSMRGRVIFVSHEWLGWAHPDPHGRQFAVLKRVLTRLMNGEIKNVESHFMQKMAFNMSTKTGSDEWKNAVPHMYIWLDFASIPQMCAKSVTQSTEMAATSSAPISSQSSAPAYYSGAKLEEEQVKVAKLLKNAVDSIPAYIERSTLLLILVPVALHANRQVGCSFGTWCRRGWCRLELLASYLKPGDIEILVCKGPESQPYFMFPSDILVLLPGLGDFTCCQRNHDIDGRQIPCDRDKIGVVMENMCNSKSKYFSTTGQIDRYRFLRAISGYLMTGLSKKRMTNWLAEEADEEQGLVQDPLERLKTKLQWQPGDDAPARKTGRTLLWYATLADDSEAVISLLKDPEHLATLNIRAKNIFPASGEWDSFPLSNAMWLGSPGLMEQLLDAKANPECMDAKKHDPLMFACMFGRYKNVEAWLDRFPKWQLERRDGIAGNTALILGVLQSTDGKAEIVKILLDRRANPSAIADNGMGVLHHLTFSNNYETVAGTTTRLLLDARVDPNSRMPARTGAIACILCIARCSIRCGSKDVLLKEFAKWSRLPALSCAAYQGNVDLVQLLIELRADPHLPNQEGLTPLQLAKRDFGGEAPPLLEALLK